MKITLIAGSNRANASSTNHLRYMGQLFTDLQVSVKFIDLSALPLPLFTPDNWDFHPNVRLMLEAIEAADGLVLATPEYHGSISGALKNALDYVQIPQVAGKPVLSVSSAGGPLGVSSLTHLQTIVRNLHGVNCSDQVSVGYGANEFGPDGAPVDAAMRDRIQVAVQRFVELTRRLATSVEAAS